MAQAELAARELGLRRGEWRRVRNSHDLDGVAATDIVTVTPLLEPYGSADYIRREVIDRVVRRIEARDGVTGPTVRT